MLLHYHYVSTSLTMQIPAETLSQTHRVCFMLLCYRSAYRANSYGNAIAKPQGLLHAETGLSYFGARYYDSDLMIGWLSVDPLADKYPNISPYAYCAWNPTRLVDPDGRKIKYAHGTSEEFKKKFEVTIKYMNSKGTPAILAELEKRNEIIYISELDSDGPRFSPSKNTIFWNPHLGVLTDEGVVISPATVLNHEADHALQYLKNQQ